MGAKIDRAPSTKVVWSWLSGAGTSQEVWSLIWCLFEALATFFPRFPFCYRTASLALLKYPSILALISFCNTEVNHTCFDSTVKDYQPPHNFYPFCTLEIFLCKMPLYRRFFSVEGVDRKGVKGDKPNKVNVKENAKTKYYSALFVCVNCKL